MDVTLTFQGLFEMHQTLDQLGPESEARVYPPALRAMAAVVRRQARKKNYGFTDGEGVRPFDRARGRTESVRLRSTVSLEGIGARYGNRNYRRGRYAVFAGGQGARHGYLVEAGHGGPRPARPHPFLTRAVLDTQRQQFNAFVDKAQERFPEAVARARARGNALGASFGRTL